MLQKEEVKAVYRFLKFVSYVWWTIVMPLMELPNITMPFLVQSVVEFADTLFVHPQERKFIMLHHTLMSTYIAMWHMQSQMQTQDAKTVLHILFVAQFWPIVLYRACTNQRYILLGQTTKNVLMFAQIAVPGVVAPIVVLRAYPFAIVFSTGMALVTAIGTIFFEVLAFLKRRYTIELLYTHMDHMTNDVVIDPLCDDDT